jgi:hypothetical protein
VLAISGDRVGGVTPPRDLNILLKALALTVSCGVCSCTCKQTVNVRADRGSAIMYLISFLSNSTASFCVPLRHVILYRNVNSIASRLSTKPAYM